MVNKRLKLLRKQNKLSQIQVADAIGVERSAYCSYETGRRNVSIETLLKIVEFYKIPIEVFFESENDFKVSEDGYEPNEKIYLSQLSKNERDLIVYYRAANEQNKKKVTDIVKENFK